MSNGGSGMAHRPVLLDEALDGLALGPDGVYVDATFGRGGHAGAILDRLSARGRLLALDKDPEAILAARERFGGDPRLVLERGSFAGLNRVLGRLGWLGRVQGILMDLGVSSPQLDTPGRGFSFSSDGPLDMRMDTGAGATAAEWLARAKEAEIRQVLRSFGEERHAGRIARAIVRERQAAPIVTTGHLSRVVAEAVPRHEPGKHPATRTFQALRILVNAELEDLDRVLPQTLEALARGGRLVVISFHSLEDRRVKRFMRAQSKGDNLPKDLPVTADQLRPTMRLVGKPVRAGERELAGNPRARSAVLRVAERL